MAKLYKLRFTQDEFVSKDSDIWRTDVIDLYVNDQYKNYSVLTSTYGLDLLGNGIYTGLNSPDGVNTEIGFVEDSRFIDTSGRIDIFDWKVSVSQVATASVLTKLNVYTTEEAGLDPYYDHATPSLVDDWSIISDLEPGDPISSLDSFRYAFFELVFDSDAAVETDSEIELIITVEIQPPVVNGFFDGTRRALDRFPEWMSMREYDAATPEDGATPVQLGSTFINAAAGEWLSDLRGKINYQEFQKYIENVDLDQKHLVWRTSNVPVDIFSVTYVDGLEDIQLSTASSIGEFYKTGNDQHAFLYNRTTAEIYCLQEYPDGELKINGEAVVQEPYQVWNAIDDIGITVDLYRFPQEDNDSFRKRILDVYISTPGVSVERFKKSIRRELNLWKYFGATPDSFYEGATPEVLTIEDLENSLEYFDSAGNPKPAFYSLVDRLARDYPMTWGLFNYGEAFWDADGLTHKGFKTLPKLNDATPASGSTYQSGVGDLNDLFVLRPDFYKPEQEFDVDLVIRGRRPTVLEDVYTQIEFDITVTGLANRTVATPVPVADKFTLWLSEDNVTYYYATFDLTSSYYGGDPGDIDLQDYDPSTTWPPPAILNSAKSYYGWFGEDGKVSSYLSFFNATTGEPEDGYSPSLEDLTTLRVYPGEYDFDTTSFINTPDDDLYQLKFVDPETPQTIGYDSATAYLTVNVAAADFSDENYALEYQGWGFEATADVEDGYRSIPQVFRIVLNKNNQLQNTTITVQNFDWPDYNGPTLESQKLELIITETDASGDYGVYTNTGRFIEVTNIEVNGDDTWVDGVLVLEPTPADSFELEFECSSATSYPEDIDIWETFKESYSPGIANRKVNEHGPYRYDQAPLIGNVDSTLDRIEVTRADFGLGPYDVPTWIGVDTVSNPNVVAWTNTNTIIPLSSSLTEYPAESLVEDAERIGFVDIHARLKSNMNPGWDPFVHSGWFYEDDLEHYLFADAQTGTVASGSEYTLVLGDLTPTQNYQGAPVIVNKNDEQLRQVPHFGATPPNDFVITEIKKGTGTTSLFVGYPNIEEIEITNLSINEAVSSVTESETNEIICSGVTNKEHEYEISYKPVFSFYVDNIATPGQSKLHFSESAEVGTPYIVTWEGSPLMPATPMSMPLHPLHTALTEGFLYIDQDEQPLSSIDVTISPSEMLATPGDYSMVTVRTFDRNGNPKPNVSLSIESGAGTTTTEEEVTTDEFGHAFFYIESSTTATPGNLVVSYFSEHEDATVAGSVSKNYLIEQMPYERNKIKAVLDSVEIPADQSSATELFGYVYDKFDNPIPYAVIYWRKARDIKTLLSDISWSTSSATPGSDGTAGRVVADSSGRFVIGPFISQDEPGFWLVSVESGSASPDMDGDQFPLAGDVTYWYEYLGVTNILDTISLQPIYSYQSSTPPYLYEDFSATPAFPVTFDERDYQGTPNTPAINWLPPEWYPMSRYEQYQLKLLGNDYYTIDVATPPYDDSVES